jgi:hypothetical protein
MLVIATGLAISHKYSPADVFTARKTETVNNIAAFTGGTAATGTTPTLCRMGVWQVNSDESLTLVGACTNDTTLLFRPRCWGRQARILGSDREAARSTRRASRCASSATAPCSTRQGILGPCASRSR